MHNRPNITPTQKPSSGSGAVWDGEDWRSGSGNSLNYKYRMHDPRIGRFFAVDPLAAKYPYYSQYAFSGNRVIDMVELEGQEPAEPGKEKGELSGAYMENGEWDGHKSDSYYVWTWDGVRWNSPIASNENVFSVDGRYGPQVSEDIVKESENGQSGSLLITSVNYSLTAANTLSDLNEANIIKSVTITKFLREGKNWIPVAGALIEMAKLKDGMGSISPADAISAIPGVGLMSIPINHEMEKIEQGQMEMDRIYASLSWKNMVKYSKQNNNSYNIHVIFVYAAADVHTGLMNAVPTSVAFDNIEIATEFLGFKPTVVYFKFITEDSPSFLMDGTNKLQFTPKE